MSHFPEVPQILYADTSNKASVYSNTVNQILIFNCNFGIFKFIYLPLDINKSLNNSIKFGME